MYALAYMHIYIQIKIKIIQDMYLLQNGSCIALMNGIN